MFDPGTDIALQQCRELVLHDFRLAEQALVHRELLQTRLLGSDPVAFRISIRPGSFGQVVCVVADITALCLRCPPLSTPEEGGGWPSELSPSENMLTARMFLCFARYAKVTSGAPSLTIK